MAAATYRDPGNHKSNSICQRRASLQKKLPADFVLVLSILRCKCYRVRALLPQTRGYSVPSCTDTGKSGAKEGFYFLRIPESSWNFFICGWVRSPLQSSSAYSKLNTAWPRCGPVDCWLNFSNCARKQKRLFA